MVTVEAVSAKGRSLLGEHGNQWAVVRHRATVPAFNYKPGTLIEANSGYRRWVADHNDRHIRIVK